jgi:hypothetical protein
MDDKRFQEEIPDDPSLEEMWEILEEIERLIELDEELERRERHPFRLYLPFASSRRR